MNSLRNTREDLINDRTKLRSKFTETVTIATLAQKYGVKKAGREKMISEITVKINDELRGMDSHY